MSPYPAALGLIASFAFISFFASKERKRIDWFPYFGFMIVAGTVITKSPREYGWAEAIVYVAVAFLWIRLAPAAKSEYDADATKSTEDS